MTTLEDRALAAFFGVALGDALGATVEFMTPSEIAAQYGVHQKIIGGGWLRLKPGDVTDDTQMSLALGRSLLRAQKFDPRDVCEEFAAWLRSHPPDVGNACRRGIRRYIVHGAVSGEFSEGDAGNGAAMRLLPAALATLHDRSLTEAWVIGQAHITHHHPLSDAACVALAQMVQALALGQGKAAAQDIADALVERLPVFRYRDYQGPATGFIVDTMRTVLKAFFATDNFFDCLVATVNRGDDADTTGAIAGMLAGAAYGLAGLPRHWRDRLDPAIAREIFAQASALTRLTQPGSRDNSAS